MTGSASRFFVRNNGNIGIGTTAPSALLEVSNAVPGGPANMWMTSYTNTLGPYYLARRARGTSGGPMAVQTGDGLAGFYGQGYGTTTFGPAFTGGMTVQAAQNFSDTAQGTALTFMTTSINATSPTTRMTLEASGRLGIGTGTVPVTGTLEASNADLPLPYTQVSATTVASSPQGSLFVGRMTRGTADAPSAVQDGDVLAGFLGRGYGATNFNGTGNGGMFVRAAETWTDSAQGTSIHFNTTATGTNTPTTRMAIMPDGNVGIGTFTDIPTITDKLQVFGDIRMGTSGTNGCLRNFAGTGLIGVCSSDRRFKKDITPFSPVLNQLTALQPVHYFWRAADFPQQHFGDSRAYGLIAQDVEEDIVQLVITGDDGFKAIDYTMLPLLTIQAVKELKAEHDALKARVNELERLVTEMLAKAAPR